MTVAEPIYEAVTRDIHVRVEPAYLEDRSSPDDSYYFWAYTVEIENRGDAAVQLRSRVWRITDAQGRVQTVRGPGVVGQEPLIEPGEVFRYTSGVPLPTASGFMTGCYQMEGEGGEAFDVEIPAFSLDCPDEQVSIN
jgi:ApaG protein